jgi:hypothetical protein
MTKMRRIISNLACLVNVAQIFGIDPIAVPLAETVHPVLSKRVASQIPLLDSRGFEVSEEYRDSSV